jgi:hypothetical protein
MVRHVIMREIGQQKWRVATVKAEARLRSMFQVERSLHWKPKRLIIALRREPQTNHPRYRI